MIFYNGRGSGNVPYDFIILKIREFLSRSIDYSLNKLLFEFYIYEGRFSDMTYLHMLYNESMQEYYIVFTYFSDKQEQKFMVMVDNNDGDLIRKTIEKAKINKKVKMVQGLLDGFTVGFIFKEKDIYEWWVICPKEWGRLIKVTNILLKYLPNDIKACYEGRIN